MMELDVLNKVSHMRLVPLLGHCLEHDSEKLLVYKYMPNGDLYNSLYRVTNLEDDNLQSLDQITRLKIAIGAAEGLSYLHHECSPPLVHRYCKAFFQLFFFCLLSYRWHFVNIHYLWLAKVVMLRFQLFVFQNAYPWVQQGCVTLCSFFFLFFKRIAFPCVEQELFGSLSMYDLRCSHYKPFIFSNQIEASCCFEFHVRIHRTFWWLQTVELNTALPCSAEIGG